MVLSGSLPDSTADYAEIISSVFALISMQHIYDIKGCVLVKIEHLGAVGHAERCEGIANAFLLSLKGDLKSIRDTAKKIVLVGGAGKEYFEVEALLGHHGISVDLYADSSFSLSGKYFGGKPIQSAYDLLKESEKYYFIVVGPEKSAMSRINSVLIQLRFYNVPDSSISIFFETYFHDFTAENPDLKADILAAVNEVGFDETQNGTISTSGNVSGGLSLAKMGTFVEFLYSTAWSHHVYLWEREYIQNLPKSRILEIGPGEGLMSLVLLNKFKSINIDWLLFAARPFELGGALRKIKMKYPDQITEFFGMIEKRDFALPENAYDVIIMTEVFEHFTLNPIPTMKKIRKSLRDGGRMFLTTPNWGHVHIYKSWKELPNGSDISDEDYLKLYVGHTYQYTKSELEEIFAESGFAVERYAESESNNHNFLLKKNPDFSR